MPVPVASTHANRCGLDSNVNAVAETAGPFARLGGGGAAAAVPKPAAPAPPAAAATPMDTDGPITTPMEDVVVIDGLNFSYPGVDGRPLEGSEPLIKDMRLTLKRGRRCLLIGPNGAGKTTLLKVISGKHMVDESSIRILGHPPFHTTSLESSGKLNYVGGNWERDIAFAGYSVPLQGDFPARKMLDSIHGIPEARKQKLIEVMDIDPDWRMHLVSDGQRRRVQIAVGLLQPFEVLLLDEVTVDLDILGRKDLMDFLKQECEERGATVIYATHIFDGLEDWPTDIAYVANGTLKKFAPATEFPMLQEGKLLEMVDGWLRAEYKERKAAPKKPKAKIFKVNNGWSAGTLNPSVQLSHSSNTVMRC